MKNLIIMPVCGNLGLVQKAIASCLNQDIEGGVRLLIIDDFSQDGTREWLLSQSIPMGFASYLFSRSHGVSHAWNCGLGLLFDDSLAFNVDVHVHALVVNSDVELPPDFYRRLVADGGGFVTGLDSNNKDEWRDDEKRRCPNFSAFLIRREVWDRVGTFDEDMKIFCSDCDYHIRMEQAEVDAYCIGAKFKHYGSATIKLADEQENKRISDQAALDRLAFERKWGCLPGSPEYAAMFPRDHVVVEVAK